MATDIAIFPKSNSVSFYPAVSNGLNVIGQASYVQQIQSWQAELPYVQKVLNTDRLCILVHTQNNGYTPKIWICDSNMNVISGVNPNVHPYYKNSQNVTGNNYIDNYGTVTPLTSTRWGFSFDDFVLDIPDGGIFYLRVDNYDGVSSYVSYYSEPLLVINTFDIPLLQIQFSYNTNISNKNIIIGGWWHDITNPDPDNPLFSLRVEGYVIPTAPKVLNIGYLQQQYNQNQIKTLQKRFFTLKVGEIQIGIPYYMLEKVTEALLADNVWINGYQFILYNQQGQTSLSDLWKVRATDVAPLVYGECILMQLNDSQDALVNPTPDPFRIYTDVYTDVYS